jgi:hypothetical protein
MSVRLAAQLMWIRDSGVMMTMMMMKRMKWMRKRVGLRTKMKGSAVWKDSVSNSAGHTRERLWGLEEERRI